jgi:hypothetical protein
MVTPADAVISIKTIVQNGPYGRYGGYEQYRPTNCNTARSGKDAASQVQAGPNAKLNAGSSFAQLRRTRTPGLFAPFTYTIYFDATSERGTCSGKVSTCVPALEGLACDEYFGDDATETPNCEN